MLARERFAITGVQVRGQLPLAQGLGGPRGILSGGDAGGGVVAEPPSPAPNTSIALTATTTARSERPGAPPIVSPQPRAAAAQVAQRPNISTV